MKITLEKKSNGIHSYLTLNIELGNCFTKTPTDVDIINKMVEFVDSYNKEAIEKA